jgi:hypothetical protein
MLSYLFIFSAPPLQGQRRLCKALLCQDRLIKYKKAEKEEVLQRFVLKKSQIRSLFFVKMSKTKEDFQSSISVLSMRA